MGLGILDMSFMIATQHINFKCRKCGRKRKGEFTVPWPVKRSEAAKKMGFKNTSHGSQCTNGPDGGCESAYDKISDLRKISYGLDGPNVSDKLRSIADWFEARL